jgi:hypothetical protein
MDLYRYDLGTWSMEQLTDHPYCEWHPETNGRHIAYERSVAEGGDAPAENLLWDLQTDSVIQFAEPGSNAGYFDINDRYLAWSRYPSSGSSLGKDVFYRHLETGDTTQIPNSALYYCYDVRLGGEYLTYAGSEYWGQLPFHLFLHHLPTGEELHLDGGPTINGITHGAIDAGIVAWNTTQHAIDFDPFDPTTDVELYDIEIDGYRRLTTARSALRVWDLQVPWITFIVSLGEYVYEYYVAHLERLGVVDANGRLLPGDAVLEPPL